MSTRLTGNLTRDLDYDNLTFIVDNKVGSSKLQVDNEYEVGSNCYTNSGKTFVGCKTTKEVSALVAKYNPENVDDVNDILCGILEEETHYYLSYIVDGASFHSDNFIYMPAYNDLVDDVSFYRNIEG